MFRSTITLVHVGVQVVGGIYRQGRFSLDADLSKDAVVEIAVHAGVSVKRYGDSEMLCLGRPLDVALLVDKLIVTFRLSDIVPP